MYRRYGRIGQDDELNADDDGLVQSDGGEKTDSSTDNEDSPIQVKRAHAQRQEEEEEEDGEGRAVMHRPAARSNLRSLGAERQEDRTEEQAAEQQRETGRTTSTRRRSRVSLSESPGPKRRRTVSLPFSSLPSFPPP
jgi:hypothetical protein